MLIIDHFLSLEYPFIFLILRFFMCPLPSLFISEKDFCFSTNNQQIFSPIQYFSSLIFHYSRLIVVYIHSASHYPVLITLFIEGDSRFLLFAFPSAFLNLHLNFKISHTPLTTHSISLLLIWYSLLISSHVLSYILLSRILISLWLSFQ